MSMLYRKPHILALLLLVLFVVAITIFVILSFVTHTNSWHAGLSLGPNVWYPYP
jgi:hypothetical protein